MSTVLTDAPTATRPERFAGGSFVDRVIASGDLIGFIALHAAALYGIARVGVSWQALALLAITYSVRTWGVCVGFHRYFSHRSFTTSRSFQFVIALIGTTAMQKGALWWATTHRRHHRLADTPGDPHSPHHRSFLYSHCGWVFDPAHQGYDRRVVDDLVRYPELVWLERFKLVPVVALAAGLWFAFGAQGFVWGFCVSTVALWHATLSTGSFSHRLGGYRNFEIADDSRNNRLIAALLLGEGWHNNHHRAPNSARHGIDRREPDPLHASIRVLAALGLVWSLRDTLPRHPTDAPTSEPV